MSFNKPYPIWSTCGSNPYQVNKAIVEAKILYGRHANDEMTNLADTGGRTSYLILLTIRPRKNKKSWFFAQLLHWSPMIYTLSSCVQILHSLDKVMQFLLPTRLELGRPQVIWLGADSSIQPLHGDTYTMNRSRLIKLKLGLQHCV